jgi:hypothetical protein
MRDVRRDAVATAFSDGGPGIPDDVREKVFTPAGGTTVVVRIPMAIS